MTPEEYADEIMGSEAIMWLVAGANHPDMWLTDLREMYDEWVKLGGKGYGKRHIIEEIELGAERADGWGLAPATPEEDALLDEWDEDSDYCSVCDILLADLGGSSHYHCGNCGEETGMMGCSMLYDDGEWDFACKPENANRKRKSYK